MNSGAPALQQVSNTAPTFQPGMSAPTTPMPDKSPASLIHGSPFHRALQRRGIDMPTQAQMPATAQPNASGDVTLPIQDANPSQPGVQVPPSEAELIIKALTSRLHMLGKHESAVRDALLAPAQEQEASEQ